MTCSDIIKGTTFIVAFFAFLVAFHHVDETYFRVDYTVARPHGPLPYPGPCICA